MKTPRQQMRSIIERICEKHGACYRDVIGSNCKIPHIAEARMEAYRTLLAAGFTRDQIISHFGGRENVRFQIRYALRGRAIYHAAAE